MAENIQVHLFNRVELLVHPFFAVENARAEGKANGLINVTAQDVLKDYEEFRIVENWKRKIQTMSKNPRAIMILVGPQALESRPEHLLHFKGKLGARKLEKFTKEYQELLEYAKRTLGKRLFYVSHNIGGREYYLARYMHARKYFPGKDVRVYAYGEYLGTGEYPACVDWVSKEAENMLTKVQTEIWKGQKVKLTLLKVKDVRTGRVKHQVTSIESLHGFTTLQQAEAIRRLKKKGKLSPYFVKYRYNADPNMDFKTAARNLSAGWKSAQAKRGK